MNERTDKRMDGYTDGRTEEQTKGRTKCLSNSLSLITQKLTSKIQLNYSAKLKSSLDNTTLQVMLKLVRTKIKIYSLPKVKVKPEESTPIGYCHEIFGNITSNHCSCTRCWLLSSINQLGLSLFTTLQS